MVLTLLAPLPATAEDLTVIGRFQFMQAVREIEASLDTMTQINWNITEQISKATGARVRDYGWDAAARRVYVARRELGIEFDSIRKLEREILWWEEVLTNPGKYVKFIPQIKGLEELAGQSKDNLELMLVLTKSREYLVERIRLLQRGKIPIPSPSNPVSNRIDKASTLMGRLYDSGTITSDQYLEYLKSSNCYRQAMGILSGKPREKPMPGDVWLGEWEGKFQPNEVPLEFDYSFTVSRTCSDYEIESLMSGGEEIKVIKIGPSALEFHYLGESGTKVTLSLTGTGNFAGTLVSTTTGGQLEGSVREF